MHSIMYYTIMPDGTVKQLNPFTGTEVWAVAGAGPTGGEREPCGGKAGGDPFP